MHIIITWKQETEGFPSSWQPLSYVISEISHPMNIYSFCLWCDGKNKETVPTSLPHLWQSMVSPAYFSGDSNDRFPGIPHAKGTWNTAFKGVLVPLESSSNYRASTELRTTSSHGRTQCILGRCEALDTAKIIFAFLHQGTLANYLCNLLPLLKD